MECGGNRRATPLWLAETDDHAINLPPNRDEWPGRLMAKVQVIKMG